MRNEKVMVGLIKIMKDYASVVSAGIIAIGWVVTWYLNLAHQRALKRFEYRMKALKSFLPVWNYIQKDSASLTKPEFFPILEKAREQFQLYGSNQEIKIMEKFIKAIDQKQLEEANKALARLVPFVRGQIRRELGIAE